MAVLMGPPHYPESDETGSGRRRMREKDKATKKVLVREKKGMKDKGRERGRQSERERIKKIENDYSRERARNVELKR